MRDAGKKGRYVVWIPVCGAMNIFEPLRREGRQGFSFSLIGTDDQEK